MLLCSVLCMLREISYLFIVICTCCYFYNFQAVEKDLTQEDPLYENVMTTGNNVLSSLVSDEEKLQFKQKIDTLSNLWVKVHEDLDARKRVLSDTYQTAKAFEECEENLEKWIDETADQIKNLQPVSCELEKLETQHKQAEVFYLFSRSSTIIEKYDKQQACRLQSIRRH